MLNKHIKWLEHHFPNLEVIPKSDNPMNEWLICKILVPGDSRFIVSIRKNNYGDWQIPYYDWSRHITVFSSDGLITEDNMVWYNFKEWNDKW